MLILYILLWVIIGAILLILFVSLWLLVTPFALQIDSTQNIYCLRWYGIGRIEIIPDEELFFRFNIRLLFFKWRFDFLHLPKFFFRKNAEDKKAKKKVPKKANTAKSKVKMSRILRKIKQVLASFRVRQCYLNFDSGNAVYNAWLYPLLPLVNLADNVSVEVNWVAYYEVQLDVRNSFLKILIALIK